MKRRKTDVPCFLCEKANEVCEGDIPCRRCIQLGTPQMCFGKSGVIKKEPANPVAGQTLQTNRPITAARNIQSTGVSNQQQQQKQQQQQQQQKQQQQQRQEQLRQQQLQQQQQQQPSTPAVATTSSFTPSTASSFSVSNPPKPKPRGRGRPPKNAPSGTDLSQSNMNNYLIQELKLMKHEQQKLAEEMLAVKMQNIQLNNEVAQLRRNQNSTVVPYSTSPTLRGAAFPTSGIPKGPELPIVVYDLMSNPPRVGSANASFCNMIGYDLEEIIGMPWNNLIHKDSLQRTMALLNHEHLVDTLHLQMVQCYRHKNSSAFWTTDTLIIMHDKHGRPVTAIVSIQFQGANPPPLQVPYDASLQSNPLMLTSTDPTGAQAMDTYSPIQSPFPNQHQQHNSMLFASSDQVQEFMQGLSGDNLPQQATSPVGEQQMPQATFGEYDGANFDFLDPINSHASLVSEDGDAAVDMNLDTSNPQWSGGVPTQNAFPYTNNGIQFL